MADELALRIRADDEAIADQSMQITYHGAGGRTHVTALFALDKLDYIVERIRAQRE